MATRRSSWRIIGGRACISAPGYARPGAGARAGPWPCSSRACSTGCTTSRYVFIRRVFARPARRTVSSGMSASSWPSSASRATSSPIRPTTSSSDLTAAPGRSRLFRVDRLGTFSPRHHLFPILGIHHGRFVHRLICIMWPGIPVVVARPMMLFMSFMKFSPSAPRRLCVVLG